MIRDDDNPTQEAATLVVKEHLARLFLYWYGNHKAIRRILHQDWKGKGAESDWLMMQCSNSNRMGRGLSMTDMEYQWKQVWFAKGPRTAVVDEEMRESFGCMLLALHAHRHHGYDEDLLLAQHIANHLPKRLWEKLALVILWDQIPRNMFRGTPVAYAYDDLALKIALEIATDDVVFDNLTFCFQATLCICLCHAEYLQVQTLLRRCIHTMSTRQQKSNVDQYSISASSPLWPALRQIAMHHYERVEWFGRFPERNDILGRMSTPEEVAWLQQLR